MSEVLCMECERQLLPAKPAAYVVVFMAAKVRAIALCEAHEEIIRKDSTRLLGTDKFGGLGYTQINLSDEGAIGALIRAFNETFADLERIGRLRP